MILLFILAFSTVYCIDVELFTKFEAAFTAEKTVVPGLNPYNVTDYNCTAKFSSAADDSVVVVPCFYMVPYKSYLSTPGSPEWRVRFSPRSLGPWSFNLSLVIRGRQEPVLIGAGKFNCVPQSDPETAAGFILPSNRQQPFPNKRGFIELRSGHRQFTSFFPVGMNVAGYEYRHPNISVQMKEWLTSVARQGGNYARVWTMDNVHPPAGGDQDGGGVSSLPAVAPYRLALETGPVLGVYSQVAAYNLDQVFSVAESLGIRILFCLIDQHSFRRTRRWPINMMNKANAGGFLSEPQDYLTDRRAHALFQQRARYLIARYGYSTSLFAWELWNEIDFIDSYNSDAAREWHQLMGAYVGSVDANGQHMITTSMALEKGDPVVESLPVLDFVTTHHYDNLTYGGDMAAFISGLCRLKADWYPEKPHLIGEFGVTLPHYANPLTHFKWWHNGLWAGIVSRCSGSPMAWYWQFIAKADAWSTLQGPAKFASSIPFSDYDWSNIDGTVSSSAVALRFFGSVGRSTHIKSSPHVLGWIQAVPGTTWRTNSTSPVIVTAGTASVTLYGLDGGTYLFQLFNTVTGQPFKEEHYRSSNNNNIVCHTGLCGPIQIPVTFQNDVAFTMKRLAPPPQR